MKNEHPAPACRLGVCGSRTLTDERVKIILLEEIAASAATEIVTHAEPEGVCAMARELCREKAIPLKLHFLNFKYLRGAFEHRSRDVFKDCDRCVFIWDGKSKGTHNELNMCRKLGIPHVFHELKPTPYAASVGFEIDRDWDVGTEIEVPLADFETGL
ncbi:MAG: hypothetical protein KUA37_01900 [Desulfomicrobium sp.]|nr:hypothetical protein [Pseudomonadota bacterium]MBV1710744.1 hypothetical protein [Desulfomicrobium sp.]MBU4570352.1 hypothetical protein [Pseudomonadota bacterium]MBU4593273.1 hypothetical protein [Pseudomonadota bacterium]MBV1719826.1 hypothetical protein [Desulfomicrobium sp.]